MVDRADISAARIAIDGWRIGAQAIVRMPRLFVTAYALYIIVHVFLTRYIVTPVVFDPRASSVIGTLFIRYLEVALMAALVSIPVYRAMLLGDTEDRAVWHIRPGFWRFAVCTFLWEMSFALATVPYGEGGVARMVSLIISLTALYFVIRTVLIFPLAAIGSRQGIFRPAWKASRGHFWKIIWIYVVTCFPLFVMVVVAVVVMAFSHLPFSAELSVLVSWPVGLVGIALRLLLMSLGAVVTSRLYQWLVEPDIERPGGHGSPYKPTPAAA